MPRCAAGICLVSLQHKHCYQEYDHTVNNSSAIFHPGCMGSRTLKQRSLIVLLLLCGSLLQAQNRHPEQYALLHETGTADTARADYLFELANKYAQNKPDSELIAAGEALYLSRKAKYVTGERRALKQMAEAYQFMGNYPLALHYYLERLKLDEQFGGSAEQVVTLLSMANLYQLEGDFKQALAYAKKGAVLIDRNNLDDYRWYADMVFGDAYEKMNDPANALIYDNRAYQLAAAAKNPAWLGMSLNNWGNAYLKSGNREEALRCYRRGIPYLLSSGNASFLCESYKGIATVHFETGEPDSAIIYAKKSLALAISRNFDEKYIKACELLTIIYQKQHSADSALKYQTSLMTMKDKVYSRQKSLQIATMTLEEQLRQKEQARERAEQERHRRYVLNMLLVGLLIPFSFLVSLVLSKKKMHKRVIEFSGIISLLLLFEYLTILLHPAVESWTDESPFLEIMIFVAVAAVLTPAHHRLERWMLQKLTTHHHTTAAVQPLPQHNAADNPSETA